MVANVFERDFDRASPLNREVAPGSDIKRPADLTRLGDLLPQILARYGCTNLTDAWGAEARGADTIRLHPGSTTSQKTNRPDIARERRRVG
jgi:hypothetical protein